MGAGEGPGLRRLPKQARARATVEKIIAATSRILEEVGFDHLTTERVAAAAGVSVGTVYRYFPDKDALVQALTMEHFEKLNGLVASHLTTPAADAPLGDIIRSLIRALLASQIEVLEHNRVVVGEVPAGVRLQAALPYLELQQQLIVSVLGARAASLRKMEPELVAEILVGATTGLIERTLLVSPDRLVEPAFERELVELVVRYLGDGG